MQKIILLVATFVFSFQAVTGQADDFQNKSKNELLQFIKDSIETYGNFMGIDYLVSYDDNEPNHLRISEIASGDTVWYKIDLSLAKMGASVSIMPTGKENFIITFKKEITIKEKNNRNATLDVFFYRKKDKRATDYAQLIEYFTYAFTFLIPQCKT